MAQRSGGCRTFFFGGDMRPVVHNIVAGFCDTCHDTEEWLVNSGQGVTHENP